jgi:hypothetical protein
MSREEFIALASDVFRFALTDDEICKSVATAIAQHLPAHICQLDDDQKMFVKKGSKTWNGMVVIVGTAVLMAVIGLLITVFGFGVRVWLQVKAASQ